jgi:hypothetical protein
LAAVIVFIVLLAAFRGAVTTNADHLEWAWSLLLGVTNFKSCQFRKLS